jgi:SAM-dependent methyltransferase
MTDPLESHLLAQTEGRQVDFWHEVRSRLVTARLPEPDAVVADVGAGSGKLGDILRHSSPRTDYRFYEPLDVMANQLEARFGANARLRDAHACSDADLVALLDVIEHMANPRDLLAPIADAVKPGALVVITVPALQVLWSSWDRALGHFRRYSKASLRHEIDGLPLEVLESGYLFPELLPAAFVRVVLRRGDDGSAPSEFPVLPRALDRLLAAIGSLTYRGRRFWPAGTTAFLVARRR